MPARTRSTNGRFESTATPTGKEEVFEDTPLSIPIKKTTVMNFFRIFMIFLIMSPWLFMALRKNTIENVSKKISSFYDDNFSCTSSCICEDLLTDLKSTKDNSGGEKNKTF
jgi:hypothetical protein